MISNLIPGLDIQGLAFNFIILFFAITVHEFSHGYVAYKLGDPTAKAMGRLTLNPLAHLDPLGALMMIFCGFGWAKAVPVNPYYFKDPKKDMVLVAFAGPASNLIMAFIAATLIPFATKYLIMSMPMVPLFLYFFMLRNLQFAAFNLIPFPPLDGSKILFSLLPNHLYNKFLTYENIGTIVLLLLSFTGILGNIIGLVITPILSVYGMWISFLSNLL